MAIFNENVPTSSDIIGLAELSGPEIKTPQKFAFPRAGYGGVSILPNGHYTKLAQLPGKSCMLDLKVTDDHVYTINITQDKGIFSCSIEEVHPSKSKDVKK